MFSLFAKEKASIALFESEDLLNQIGHLHQLACTTLMTSAVISMAPCLLRLDQVWAFSQKKREQIILICSRVQ